MLDLYDKGNEVSHRGVSLHVSFAVVGFQAHSSEDVGAIFNIVDESVRLAKRKCLSTPGNILSLF